MLVDFSNSPHGGKLKLLPEAYKQAQITPIGLVDHSIVGAGLGAYYYFRDLTGSESTFINNLDGELWQLMPCDRRADAQVDGNQFTVDGRTCGLLSIEHADNGDPDDFPFTKAQIESDIWLHDKLARRFGWPRRRMSAPTGDGARGLGFHSMWLDTIYMRPDRTQPWTTAAGKTCPGRPVRVRQWETVLLSAFINGTTPETDWLEELMALYETPEAFEAAMARATKAGTWQALAEWLPRYYLADNGVSNAYFPQATSVSLRRQLALAAGVSQETLAKIEADIPDPAPTPEPTT